MTHPKVSLLAGPVPPSLVGGEIEALAWILASLTLSICFATLRYSLLRVHASRVLELATDDRVRRRLVPLLRRAESLATSAGMLKVGLDLFFLALLLGWLEGDATSSWSNVAVAIVVAVPTLLLFTEVVPTALAKRYGRVLLLRALPGFFVLQLPLMVLSWAFEVVKRLGLRLLGLKDTTPETRHIVEELRHALEDPQISGEVRETQRELIENVIEFTDVDVAAIMTPRTEIHGVDVNDGLAAAIKIGAECGHSRLPVYDGNLDTIIGTISARDVVQVVSAGDLERTNLRTLVHRPYFVPETKRVSELLAEFRNEKVKMAIVLDEYGGTAGLVTLGDIIAEIVGEVQDEFDEETPSDVQVLEDGLADIVASAHVTDVNEALKLGLPEAEDYETIGGYVLAELGRLPKTGESFTRGDFEYTVLEASDRRILKVRVRRLAGEVTS
jgi:CBS domain containing-hemolysin-like protein